MIKSLYPNFLIYVPIPKLHTLTLSRPCSCGRPLYFAVSVSTELQKKNSGLTLQSEGQCYGGCWAEIVREGEGAIARVLGAGGGRPRGFAHGRQERRDFLLISCLIRLIHLLSLYREVYLTPKQAVINPNGLRPNKPLTPLTLHPTWTCSSSSSCNQTMNPLDANRTSKNHTFTSRLILNKL